MDADGPQVDLRRRRAAAQLLGGDGPQDPVGIVGRLLAIQAQDLRSARLALRARAPGLDPGAVDAALAGGSLVVAWLLRGTLHLVRREDWPWLLALTAPVSRATSRRRLGQLGVAPDDADRAVRLIGDALAAEGPLDRAALAGRLSAAGIRTEGQATPHLLMRAGLDGVLVGCGEHRYAPAPPARPVDRDAALAELGRRYLAAHAPATDADLAAWSGLGLRDARRALAGTAPEDAAPERAARPGPAPRRLLPAFDPYLLGWRDRSFAVPAEHARRVRPGGGVVRATAVDDGVAVATWTLRGGAVGLDAFAGAPGGRFAAEAADVERFAAPSGPGATLVP